MTITEALAEIKTVTKRIEAKRKFVGQYLVRGSDFKDPLEKDGGSQKSLEQETQAIKDLEQRVVDLRTAIANANATNQVSIEGVNRTIADWIIWRREVAPGRERFLDNLQRGILSVRENQRYGNLRSLSPRAGEQEKVAEIIVNISEQELSKEIEQLKNILGQLDGQLSLKNATVMVDI